MLASTRARPPRTPTRGDHLRRRLRSLQILRHRLRRDHRQRDVHGAQLALHRPEKGGRSTLRPGNDGRRHEARLRVRAVELGRHGPKPEETAFELFGAALHDVAVRRTESNRFDPGMLRRIRTYQRVIGRGIDRITMPDTVLDRRGQIDASVVTAASELYAVTPTPRRVRVTGRLDVMGASQGVLKLDVRPSEIVTARALVACNSHL